MRSTAEVAASSWPVQHTATVWINIDLHASCGHKSGSKWALASLRAHLTSKWTIVCQLIHRIIWSLYGVYTSVFTLQLEALKWTTNPMAFVAKSYQWWQHWCLSANSKSSNLWKNRPAMQKMRSACYLLKTPNRIEWNNEQYVYILSLSHFCCTATRGLIYRSKPTSVDRAIIMCLFPSPTCLTCGSHSESCKLFSMCGTGLIYMYLSH